MSLIRVDNFGPSAGGTTYSARGIAKAWVNFNGTGTVAVRDSENVSSLTDNGTGGYDVNYTTSFGSDYAASGMCSDLGYGGVIYVVYDPAYFNSAYFRFFTFPNNVPASQADAGIISITTHGDLA